MKKKERNTYMGQRIGRLKTNNVWEERKKERKKERNGVKGRKIVSTQKFGGKVKENGEIRKKRKKEGKWM